MSLVGTRPILPDELEQYELHHRANVIEFLRGGRYYLIKKPRSGCIFGRFCQ